MNTATNTLKAAAPIAAVPNVHKRDLSTNCAISDLRFLIPLQPGQSVCLVNPSCSLLEAFLSEPLNTIVVPEFDRIFFDNPDVDHLVFHHTPLNDLKKLIQDVSQTLRSKGSVLFGVQNRYKQTAIHQLKAHGFDLLGVYGAWQNIDNPEYLIPLHDSKVTRYFFEHMNRPSSLKGEVFRRAAVILALVKLHFYLFRQVVIVAEKR
ncbi:MAG: hypothetical protein C5B54_04650 [Acidobacteria bacterium]|nr:MAG: hypothetical protein C5B54_04650 [Acidobacteriota bacterium]